MTELWDDIEAESGDGVPRDRMGRPLVRLPGQTKPTAYTRVTTYAGTLEEEFALALWQQRMVALGLVARPDLLLSVSAHADDKKELNQIVDQAREAAKASAAANTGTALHRLAERYDRGQITLADVPESHRADLAAYVAMMAPLTIQGVEQFVVLDELRIGGTFDRIVEYDGQRYVADIKTGSMEYGAGKMAIQLALYSRGELYDPKTADRTPTDVSQNAGIIIHLPAGQGRCDLYWINLREGWSAVDLCTMVRAWRKRKGLLAAASFGTAVLEPPSETDQAVAVVTESFDVEVIAVNELIDACTTPDELEAIWSAHREHWTAEHTRAAAARKNQLHHKVLKDAVSTAA